MQTTTKANKGFNAPTAPVNACPTLAPIAVVDQGGPRVTGPSRAIGDPADRKPKDVAFFSEEKQESGIKTEFRTTEATETTETTETTRQLFNTNAYQGWNENEAFPLFQSENSVGGLWSLKTDDEGRYPHPPTLPLTLSLPLDSVYSFPQQSRGRMANDSGTGVTECSRAEDIGHSLVRTSAMAVPGGHPEHRHRQRCHRGGRQREKTPTFRSEEERRNWEKERRKKDIHNKVEQRRRYNINDRIQDLGILLINGGLEVRQSKGTILREAINYIRTLRADEIRLRKIETISGKLEHENNQLFNQIQRTELLLQAHGYPATATTIPQLYATEDNSRHQLHCHDLFDTTAVTPHSSGLKEEDMSCEYYQRHHHHHHHPY